MKPQSIGMTTLEKADSVVSATLVIETLAEANIGDRPETDTPKSLPEFIAIDKPDGDFSINLFTAVPLDTLEQIAKETVLGYTFESGKRSVSVTDFEIYGQGNKLVCNTTLKGDYNGSIYTVSYTHLTLPTIYSV